MNHKMTTPLYITTLNSDVTARVGYVLKRYPRFSETFVVNEILAHEEVGLPIDIFALRPNLDSHFQHCIADVQARVTHLRYSAIKGETLWGELASFGKDHPETWPLMQELIEESAIDLYQGLLLAKDVQARNITHLHAHFATSACSVARIASLLTGIPYTVTAHAKDIFHESVDEVALGRKLADAKAVITVSDFNVRDLKRRFPLCKTTIERIYNGLPLNLYQYLDPVDRPPKIVAVGRLVEKKGFSDLVKACALLRDAGISFACEIIGDGECAPELRSLISHLQLNEYVTLAGPQPHRKAHAALQRAAVCAAPCITATTGDRDGLPTVLLEAMALGTPCVSTDVTGITELVSHEETGLVVPEQNPQMLSVAIQRLFSDTALRVKLARAGRRLIEDQFDVCLATAKQREFFCSDVQVHTSATSAACLAEVG